MLMLRNDPTSGAKDRKTQLFSSNRLFYSFSFSFFWSFLFFFGLSVSVSSIFFFSFSFFLFFFFFLLACTKFAPFPRGKRRAFIGLADST